MARIISSWNELENVLNDAYVEAATSGNYANNEISKALKTRKEQLETQMRDFIRKMRDCVAEAAGRYYNLGFEPKVYKRRKDGGNMVEGVKKSSLRREAAAGAEVAYYIEFDHDLLKSKSLWGDPHYDGNRFNLIQTGWNVEKDVWFKNIEHFGKQEPFDILGQAIDMFRERYDKHHKFIIRIKGTDEVHPNDMDNVYFD